MGERTSALVTINGGKDRGRKAIRSELEDGGSCALKVLKVVEVRYKNIVLHQAPLCKRHNKYSIGIHVTW